MFRLFAIIALTAGLAFTTQQSTAAAGGPTVQALLGAVRYEDLSIESNDGTISQSIESSTLPQFGGVWSTAPKGDRIQFGLECSFLMAFNYGSSTFSAGTSRVYADYSLWTFDLAGGLYANLFLGKAEKVRIYAAGGPLIMPILTYSEGYQDNPINDYYYRSNESAFSYGLYARTGVEIRVNEYGMLGVGVRGTWVETDLGNINDFTGIGAFVTYTTSL